MSLLSIILNTAHWIDTTDWCVRTSRR